MIQTLRICKNLGEHGQTQERAPVIRAPRSLWQGLCASGRRGTEPAPGVPLCAGPSWRCPGHGDTTALQQPAPCPHRHQRRQGLGLRLLPRGPCTVVAQDASPGRTGHHVSSGSCCFPSSSGLGIAALTPHRCTPRHRRKMPSPPPRDSTIHAARSQGRGARARSACPGHLRPLDQLGALTCR